MGITGSARLLMFEETGTEKNEVRFQNEFAS
jgi:hypothetical protein